MAVVETEAETEIAVNIADIKPAGPFSAFERMVAGRYLRARRKEAFISVIAGFSFVGIMLGVATLIIVMAVMNGFRAELMKTILGVNGHLIAQPIESPFEDYAVLVERINQVDGVRFAVPLVEGQTLSSGNVGAGTGALVRGVREQDLRKLDLVSDNIKLGTLDDFDSGSGVAIGARMAENLGLTIGDILTLVSPDGDVTPFGTTPRVKGYPVNAIFEVGMSEYDSSIVYLPLTEAQAYFNADGIAQFIEIFVDEPDNVDEMRSGIEAAALRPMFLSDWRQRNRTFFAALEIERNAMFMILTMIIIVATLNIVSGLIMLVKDKGRDIAILRTMGATSGSILRIFIMTGSAIGMVGTIAGLGLALLVCSNMSSIQTFLNWASGTQVWDPTVRFLSDIPVKIDMSETLLVLALGMGLSFLATLFPAWRAAKLDPVDALRNE